jgi:hypothetical protein
VRHLPLVVAGVGVPLALLALADPYTSLTTSTVTYPGRRIAVMLDASDSMTSWFTAESLLSVDTATGNRLRLSGTTAPTLGSGPPFGTASSRVAADGHVWTGADASGGVPLVTRVNVDLDDPNVGDREPYYAECGPLVAYDNEDVIVYGEFGSFWVIGKDSSIYLYDPATKNSNRISR